MEKAKLQHLIDTYDGFLLDIWGVLYDGELLFEGSISLLETLNAHNKKIILLSNSPQRAARLAEELTRVGLGRHLYATLITAGELARTLLVTQQLKEKIKGYHYFYLGETESQDLLANTDYCRVRKIESADFLLINGVPEALKHEEISDLFQYAVAASLTALCTNPDLSITTQTGVVYPCAGYTAGCYEQLGGKVEYVGKPYGLIYDVALNHCNHIPKNRILGIGDTLETDIQGAKNQQLDNLWISHGRMLTSQQTSIQPTYYHFAVEDLLC